MTTPLGIHLLRIRLWWECLGEPFYLTVKLLKPSCDPPYNWQPYWVFVNRIGHGPWWRFWRRYQQVRTLGAVRQFDSADAALVQARKQAFEVLYPEAAHEALQKPEEKPHWMHWLPKETGYLISCRCGWQGEFVGPIGDPAGQFEYDRHLNEASVEERVKAMKGANQ